MDECESIFKQLSSSTCKNPYECYDVLQKLIKNCSKVFYADACLSNRTTQFIQSLNEYDKNNELIQDNKIIIHNTTNVNNRKSVIFKKKLTIKIKFWKM